jgi:hypothetical protein
LRHIGNAHGALIGLSRSGRVGGGLVLRRLDHLLGLFAADHTLIDQRLQEIDDRIAQLLERLTLVGGEAGSDGPKGEYQCRHGCP